MHKLSESLSERVPRAAWRAADESSMAPRGRGVPVRMLRDSVEEDFQEEEGTHRNLQGCTSGNGPESNFFLFSFFSGEQGPRPARSPTPPPKKRKKKPKRALRKQSPILSLSGLPTLIKGLEVAIHVGVLFPDSHRAGWASDVTDE